MSVSGDSSGGMTTYFIQVAAENNNLIGPYSTALDQLTEGVDFVV